MHSDVFKSMLQHPMKESTERSLVMDDLTTEDMEHFLDYLYTGSSELATTNPLTAITVSETYLMSNLKSVTEKTLISSLREDNSLEYLMAAEMYRCKDLKAASLTLIGETGLGDASEWTQQLKDSPQLLYELLTLTNQQRKSTPNK